MRSFNQTLFFFLYAFFLLLREDKSFEDVEWHDPELLDGARGRNEWG